MDTSTAARVFASDQSTAKHCFRDIPEAQAMAQAAFLRQSRKYLADRNIHATATGNAFKFDRGPCVLARAS